MSMSIDNIAKWGTGIKDFIKRVLIGIPMYFMLLSVDTLFGTYSLPRFFDPAVSFPTMTILGWNINLFAFVISGSLSAVQMALISKLVHEGLIEDLFAGRFSFSRLSSADAGRLKVALGLSAVDTFLVDGPAGWMIGVSLTKVFLYLLFAGLSAVGEFSAEAVWDYLVIGKFDDKSPSGPIYNQPVTQQIYATPAVADVKPRDWGSLTYLPPADQCHENDTVRLNGMPKIFKNSKWVAPYSGTNYQRPEPSYHPVSYRGRDEQGQG